MNCVSILVLLEFRPGVSESCHTRNCALVSILVLLEFRPGVFYFLGFYIFIMFQSLFCWNFVRELTSPSAVIHVHGFQSLFCWNFVREGVGRGYPISGGGFQSLFCWNFVRELICAIIQIMLSSVSILVLLEFRPGVVWGGAYLELF